MMLPCLEASRHAWGICRDGLTYGGEMVVVERLPDPDGIVTEYPSHSLTVKNILPI